MRVRAVALALLACSAGCGGTGGASKDSYSVAEVRAAYYQASDAGAGAPVRGGFVDTDIHSHANYVPTGGVEVCTLAQRSNAATQPANMIEPKAAQPAGQFMVQPARDSDIRTPTITQGALVFGTGTIAGSGMDAVAAAMAKCPASYDVRGGPAPILGTYGVTSRPLELSGWKGYAQQIAHTYPPGQDDVYYEDMAHIVVRRANVILYLDVTHKKVIGERSDSSQKAEDALKTVLQRLG